MRNGRVWLGVLSPPTQKLRININISFIPRRPDIDKWNQQGRSAITEGPDGSELSLAKSVQTLREPVDPTDFADGCHLQAPTAIL